MSDVFARFQQRAGGRQTNGEVSTRRYAASNINGETKFLGLKLEAFAEGKVRCFKFDGLSLSNNRLIQTALGEDFAKETTMAIAQRCMVHGFESFDCLESCTVVESLIEVSRFYAAVFNIEEKTFEVHTYRLPDVRSFEEARKAGPPELVHADLYVLLVEFCDEASLLVEKQARAIGLRVQISSLGLCTVCNEPTSYTNGFCGPCWNRNSEISSKIANSITALAQRQKDAK